MWRKFIENRTTTLSWMLLGPHHMHGTRMWPIATVACSVRLSAGYDHETCKNGWTNWDTIYDVYSMRPKEALLDTGLGGPDPSLWRGHTAQWPIYSKWLTRGSTSIRPACDRYCSKCATLEVLLPVRHCSFISRHWCIILPSETQRLVTVQQHTSRNTINKQYIHYRHSEANDPLSSAAWKLNRNKWYILHNAISTICHVMRS